MPGPQCRSPTSRCGARSKTRPPRAPLVSAAGSLGLCGWGHAPKPTGAPAGVSPAANQPLGPSGLPVLKENVDKRRARPRPRDEDRRSRLGPRLADRKLMCGQPPKVLGETADVVVVRV